MKRKFFIDFDNTIIDTIQAYVDTYNELYCNHPQFKTAESHLVNQYNMKDQCDLIENVLDIFEHPLFFKFAELINENTFEVLEKLNCKYQLIVCSIGTPINISRKALYLKNKLPFIKDYILISNPTCKMNKSLVNMQNSLFLDDIPSNLFSSNANEEDLYLFGKRYSWNDENLWRDNWLKNWSEVEEMLL